MIFSSPSWVPQLGQEAPDTVTVGDFVLATNLAQSSKPSNVPFVDVASGHSYTIDSLKKRVEWLARALAKDLGWLPNKGSPWDKVVAVHSLNMIDYFVLCWAVHRLNGICMPLHSTCTVAEITSHMSKAKCETIFTCPSLLPTCIEAANQLAISSEHVYTLGQPEASTQASVQLSITDLKTLEQLVSQGSLLNPLEPLAWEPGQGKSQVAFLCATSGTSGRQKLAMLTHYGLILNVLQMTTFESFANTQHGEVVTGAIPFSHSYGLLVGHLGAWRGDTLIVFPRFDMQLMLSSIPQYLIQRLYFVPPILAALAANPFLFELSDLSSVTSVVTGAAALDRALSEKLQALQPKWKFLHAWGLTETSIVATLTSTHDVWLGSSGSLLPGCQLRLVCPNGEDVKGYDETGEVLLKAPNIFTGYLGDDDSTRDAFDANGWLRTGDIGVMRVSRNGTEHLFIRDRIKDMIKVKGIQVVPADIEILLVAHPAVVEAAVIGIPDDLAGERPLAFVVRSETAMSDHSEDALRASIDGDLENKLHETHWLNGRIIFVTQIPKSQSGKVLKRELKGMVAVN